MQLVHLLFDFRGRLGRRRFNVASTVVMTFAGLVSGLGDGVAVLPGVHVSPLDAVAWWITAALIAKRYHDLDMSGWWCLLPVGAIALVAASGLMGYLKGANAAVMGPALMLGMVGLALCGWALWHAYMLCCRVGEDAPNTYGPAPSALLQAPRRAAVAVADAAADSVPDWAEKAFAAVAATPAEAVAPRREAATAMAAGPARVRSSAAPTFGRRVAAR